MLTKEFVCKCTKWSLYIRLHVTLLAFNSHFFRYFNLCWAEKENILIESTRGVIEVMILRVVVRRKGGEQHLKSISVESPSSWDDLSVSILPC